MSTLKARSHWASDTCRSRTLLRVPKNLTMFDFNSDNYDMGQMSDSDSENVSLGKRAARCPHSQLASGFVG